MYSSSYQSEEVLIPQYVNCEENDDSYRQVYGTSFPESKDDRTRWYDVLDGFHQSDDIDMTFKKLSKE